MAHYLESVKRISVMSGGFSPKECKHNSEMIIVCIGLGW